jgi:hypothetical protein
LNRLNYFSFFLSPISCTFAADLVPVFNPGLKGKPVKIRRYPRSCKKPPNLFAIRRKDQGRLLKRYHCFGSSEWEGFNNALSQKTCQVLPITIGINDHSKLSGERQEM